MARRVARSLLGIFGLNRNGSSSEGDWIFAPVHSYGRGKASGAPFDARYVTAFKVELGKIVLAASYQDLPDALKAVGLEE